MAEVTGLTAAAMQAIADATIVSAAVNGSGHLILTKSGGGTQDAGSVAGPTGPVGPAGPTGAVGVAPTGTVTMFAAALAPTDWLLCNGAAVSRTTYSALFAVIASTYGAGDGVTTFNLPNMQGKYPRMDAAHLAGVGGATSHNHPMSDHDHQIDGGSPQAIAAITMSTGAAPSLWIRRVTGTNNWTPNFQADSTPVAAASTPVSNLGAQVLGHTNLAGLTTTGSDGTDNIPPYLNLNFIIKT